MLNTEFSPWPSFTDEEARVVRDVLLSNCVNYWTGTEGRKFEQEFASWVGTKYAVAVANGTVALDLALKALGVRAGDEVIVTSRTFIASVSCIVNAGAAPIFADVEEDSGTISARTIKKVLTPRTKAVICVHLAGWPCDMDPIMDLSSEQGFGVIEDCAQAHGARYKGRSVGSVGHIGAWSFCQDKIMTTGGEGGMVTTNRETYWRSMWAYKDHGKNYNSVYESKQSTGFRWVHDSFGTNWRMLEMQAAIGRLQLQRMDIWHQKRRSNAEAIWEVCRRFSSLVTPDFSCSSCLADCQLRDAESGCVHGCYKCYVYVNPNGLLKNWTRDRIVEEISGRGVPCYQGTCSEVYLEKAFELTDWRPKVRLPIAKRLGETSIMFLVHPTLTDAEIKKTCQTIEEVMKEASG